MEVVMYIGMKKLPSNENRKSGDRGSIVDRSLNQPYNMHKMVSYRDSRPRSRVPEAIETL
jgi:hypothetical protein